MTNAIQALTQTVVATSATKNPAAVKAQAVKPARKTATKNPAASMKEAGEAKSKTAAAVKQASKASASDRITHALVDGARPAAGGMLFAFTQAWLTASGLIAGGTIAREKARKVAGSTAIAYHVKAERLKDTKGTLTLTPSGAAFFGARGASQAQVDEYVKTLTTGKPSETVKNPASIIKA
jgi:hypothetical protein